MNLAPFWPELTLAALAVAILVLDLMKIRPGTLGYLAAAGCALVAAGTLCPAAPGFGGGAAFGGFFLVDPLTRFLRVIVLGAAALVLLVSVPVIRKMKHPGEFVSIFLMAVVGLLVLSGAGELLTLYIALETATVASYCLAGMVRGDERSQEAGLKYLLLAALSSGIFLYGLSILYGLTGTTVLSTIHAVIGPSPTPLHRLGLVLIMAGLAFKISVVPFHMWVPDIYHGAPTPVAAFLSVASKAAGFAAAYRVLVMALGGLQGEWTAMLLILAALSMLVGNLVAIAQTNMKRLLAYSTIGQAGYLLLGLATASTTGGAALLFYLAAYVLMNLGAFFVVMIVSETVGSEEVDAYAGLARRSPGVALAMLLSLMSLAGVPPLVGFFGKLYLFAAAMEKGYWFLVLLGVLTSLVSVYYYLMVLRRVYIEPPPAGAGRLVVPLPMAIGLWIATAATVLLGIYPTPLAEAALAAILKLI